MRVTVAIQVGRPSGRDQRFAATTELAGSPICTYGATADEAERKAKGAALRFLGTLLERGAAQLSEIRFKTTTA
jgi:hypothetical protein